MKQLLLVFSVVALVGCGKKDDPNTGVVKSNLPSPKAVPEKLITNPIVEKAIRKELKKPTGELTEADSEKVTLLELQKNQLTDIPKGLEKLTQLTWLSIYDNQLTDAKDLEKLTQLEVLLLSNNELTDVKGLEKVTKLEGLYLDGNQLADFKGLEKLTQLVSLELKNNQLTSVKGLEELTKLEGLWLENNPDLTKAQIDELQKALPKCKIFSNPKK